MMQCYRVMRMLAFVMAGLALVALLFPFLGLAQEATIAAAPAGELDAVTAVLGILLAVSEGLAFFPGLAANGVLHAVVLILRGLKGRSALPAVLLCMVAVSLAGCQTGDGAKFSQRLIRIQGDAQRVLVEGCNALPGITVATDMIQEWLPVNQRVEQGIDVGQDLAAKICAKVLAQKGGGS